MNLKVGNLDVSIDDSIHIGADFSASYELMKECETYTEYKLKFVVKGMPENTLYTEQQFKDIRKLYLRFFKSLEK